jgi:hypothetical protein
MFVTCRKGHAASALLTFSSAAALSALAVLTCAGEASADDTKRACVAASTDGQTLQKADRLIEAGEKFRFCASGPCPELVRSRCTQWLRDLNAEIPTVIVRAKDAAGSDVVDIGVTIDGHAVAAGRQEPLDPGEHVAVVTRPDGHTQEERFLLVDGEHARVLTVHLAPQAPSHDPDPPVARSSGGLPAGTWVLGGLSLVAFGGAVFFYAQASSDLSQLQKTCSPNCTSSQTQPVFVNQDLAYVSIGVGIVALGSAIAWALLDSPPQSPPKTAASIPAFDVRPVAGGAVSTLGFRF